jgi:hypothetical protein
LFGSINSLNVALVTQKESEMGGVVSNSNSADKNLSIAAYNARFIYNNSLAINTGNSITTSVNSVMQFIYGGKISNPRVCSDC